VRESESERGAMDDIRMDMSTVCVIETKERKGTGLGSVFPHTRRDSTWYMTTSKFLQSKTVQLMST
jgi:hypothetical protein